MRAVLARLWNFRPRQPMSGLALCAIAGIWVADAIRIPHWAALTGTAVAAVAVGLRPDTTRCWLFAFLAFLTLHTLRVQENPAKALGDRIGEVSQSVRAVGIVWSEPIRPATPGRTAMAGCIIKLETLELGDRPLACGGALMQLSWAGPFPTYGDRVQLLGSVRNIQAARNPGQFDYRRYLNRLGIYSEIQTRYPNECRILGHGFGNPGTAVAIRAREWIKQQLERDLEDSPEIAALIESMVLGLRGETPEEMKDLFKHTGILHLFAVSGLNVAMLGAMIWYLLRPLRVPRRWAVWVTIPVLLFYALITGLSASCVRATLMGIVLLGGQLLERRPLLINSMAAAAFSILAWDTEQLFSVGFQFSFVLVWTIVGGSLPIQRKLEPWGRPDAFLPRPLWSKGQRMRATAWTGIASTLAVTLAAWLGSLLFSAGYFHLFSPAALVANLAAVPLAFCILGLGVLSVLTSIVSPAVAMLFNNANWAASKLLLGVVAACAQIPGGHVYVEFPGLAPAPICELTVLDFGSGSGVHVRVGECDWLVDCGPERRYRQTLAPYLQSRGINRLDTLLVTHGDSQHMGAARMVFENFKPRHVVDTVLADRSPARRALHTFLEAQQFGKTLSQRGDSFDLGAGTTMRVLYPVAGLRRAVADDKALVLLLESHGRRILLMSDSGFATEQWLLENGTDLRADVLIKGQPTKDLSGTLTFLDRVHPQVIICEAPAGPRGAAVFEQWERDVRARGIELFRQDRTGAVHVEMRERGIRVNAFLGGQTWAR